MERAKVCDTRGSMKAGTQPPLQGFVENETLLKPLWSSKDLVILYLQGMQPLFPVPSGCSFWHYLEDLSRLANQQSLYTDSVRQSSSTRPFHLLLASRWLAFGQLSIFDLINQVMWSYCWKQGDESPRNFSGNALGVLDTKISQTWEVNLLRKLAETK